MEIPCLWFTHWHNLRLENLCFWPRRKIFQCCDSHWPKFPHWFSKFWCWYLSQFFFSVSLMIYLIFLIWYSMCHIFHKFEHFLKFMICLFIKRIFPFYMNKRTITISNIKWILHEYHMNTILIENENYINIIWISYNNYSYIIWKWYEYYMNVKW